MSVLIQTKLVSRQCNPFGNSPWGTCLTRKMVTTALKDMRYAEHGSEDHAARIAYLIKNEVEDAIDIDVGIPSMQCYPNWMIQDGNHRLAAAMYLKKPFILANVGGSISYAKEIFEVDISDD